MIIIISIIQPIEVKSHTGESSINRQDNNLKNIACHSNFFVLYFMFPCRLRASSKKSPISNSFSIHLVENFQGYRELG